METSFSQAQLEDPALAEADRILRACNHYGFCTATCPTYVLLGDELDAPRGRIDLMHAMLAKSGPPDADTVARIDRCLSCLACMTTCAVNVDYMHLVDIGRAHIEKTYRRPIADRLFRATLAFVLPHPKRLRAALLLARLAWPFRNLLPDRLRVMLDLATQSHVAHAPMPENKSGGRSVALLPGCVQDVIAPGINAATARLLARVKIGMTIPNCGCCGSLTLHMGREDEAKAMARKTIDALWAHVDHIDAVLVTASGCGTTVKDYAHLLRDDAGYAHKAARISSLAKDVSEFLHGTGIATNLKVRRAVAYHDACSMRNAQKVTDQPRELLRSLGFEVRDVPENQLCCGSAGTYNILQPAIAAQLGRRKADHVLSTHAPVLAVGNIGCITQLRRFLGSVPVVHTVELVDWATGGPVPASLAGFSWPELPEECENAAAIEQAAGFGEREDVMESNYRSFYDDLAGRIGANAVDVSPATVNRFGENTLPSRNRQPSGVVFPSSTRDVVTIVEAANRHKVSLFPISTGNNIGIGSRSPVRAGSCVVDLGRKMNQIIEVNDNLGYAIVEPGVTFQALHDELKRLGDKYMMSPTSGPPLGGVLGNAMDKGGGYGPYFDHFGMLCGMEVVLGNGDVMRTGDGSLDSPSLLNFHVSKYSFGPILDGLFAQSNFGIVTRAAIWLMPRPPEIQTFHFAFPDDGDLGQIIDLTRPLKLSNFVPTLFRLTNDLYLIGTEDKNPEYTAGTKRAISAEARAQLRSKHGVGAWNVSGAFFGPTRAAIEPMLERVKGHFGKNGKAKYISHNEAEQIPPYKIAIEAFSGRPHQGELGLLDWRPGGGNSWFTPGTPMLGSAAQELDQIARAIYDRHGMDFIIMHVASARFARGLHMLVWNKEDDEENARADACYRALTAEFAKRGVGVGRAPTDYQDQHMSLLMPSFQNACRSIKLALDPNGVIAPGKYGIV